MDSGRHQAETIKAPSSQAGAVPGASFQRARPTAGRDGQGESRPQHPGAQPGASPHCAGLRSFPAGQRGTRQAAARRRWRPREVP